MVSYSDLDLSAPQDVSALRHRVSRAIRQVCRQPHPGTRLPTASERDCRRAAQADSERQLHIAIAANGAGHGERGRQIALRSR